MKTFHRRCPNPWAVLVATILSVTPVWAQPQPGAGAAPTDPAPAPAAEVTRDDQFQAEPAPPDRAPSRQRLDEVVVVQGNAAVNADQTAEEVVVVRGNATVEGDVDGDVVVILGNLRLTGKVGGDVVVIGGEAEINGPVEGSMVLVLTRGRLGPKADIHDEAVIVGPVPEIDPGARLRADKRIISIGPMMGFFEKFRDYLFQGVLWMRPFPPRLGWVWGVAATFLVLNLLIAALLSKPLTRCAATLQEQPARSFLVGLLACILVAPIGLLLSFTIIAPLLLWVSFCALCLFGRVVVYGATGAAVGRATGLGALNHPVLAVLAGTILFYVSYMIPVVGYIVYWFILPWGLGAALIRIFEATRREVRPVPVINPATRATTGGGWSGVATASGIVAGSTAPPTDTTTIPRPDPETPPPLKAPESSGLIGSAELLGSPRVGFWPRFGAAIIDLVIVATINGLTFGQFRTFWLILALYHVGLWTWKATTLGGILLNLRLVRLDGRPVDWQTAVVRALASVLSLISLGLGFFWASWDTEYQSWHDRIAGTTIVRANRRLALV